MACHRYGGEGIQSSKCARLAQSLTAKGIRKSTTQVPVCNTRSQEFVFWDSPSPKWGSQKGIRSWRFWNASSKALERHLNLFVGSPLLGTPLGGRCWAWPEPILFVIVYLVFYVIYNYTIVIYIYIYIHIEREREIPVCVYIYIYICIRDTGPGPFRVVPMQQRLRHLLELQLLSPGGAELYIYIYIYVYIEREIDRERERDYIML